MKNYRKLAPVVLIVLMVASWYKLISNAIETDGQYVNYLNEARGYAKKGITKYAIENYNMALEIEDNVEIYVEIAEYYKGQGKDAEYLSWCEKFIEMHPTEVKAYDCLTKAYLEEKDYASCYDILYTAEKRGITSDTLQEIKSEIEYVYKLDFNTYEDVGVYGNNFSPVMSNEVWGFVDRYGNQKIACKYLQVANYTQSAFAPVVNRDNEAYFIDKTGAKVLVPDEAYKSFGPLINNVIAAEKTDGKYTYVDQNFQVLFGNYDYASAMNNEIAAVKNGENWSIIDVNGKETTQTKYIDIKLDEKTIPYRNDRLFVSTEENKYSMVDAAGKQIGKQVYEDARVFAGESYAAVKINGKWGFVDKEGNMVIEPQYMDARSFLNGLAAVQINDKWGFIDESGKVVIAAEFNDAKDFNEKGSCFVKVGDKWQLLKLYRLNREG